MIKMINLKKTLKNFLFLFIITPIIFGLSLTVAQDLFKNQEQGLMAAVISDRGHNVVPERQGDYSENLPSGDLTTQFIPQFIKIILGLVRLLITVMIIYAGYLFVTHFGEDEALTKAKSILNYCVLGIAFIALAYAIVWGVANLKFTRT
jgi:hypothetical protein